MRTLLAAVVFAVAAAPAAAHACGGFFQPADAVSTVTDHRIAIALSDRQTTLWDQIQYHGQPGDFVWVLPTPTPATIELAHAEFFDTLESQTAPRVVGPARGGGGNPGGFGCAFGEGSASISPSAGEDPDVTVLHHGQVGPYETATVAGADSRALLAWMASHGYAVPPSARPAIEYYVAQGWVFNLLRLKPDASVSQMQPVRVVFRGMVTVFPLRLVGTGAADAVGIVLWVIADQRYQAANYDTVVLDESMLRWSTTSNRSNYRQLFASTLARHPGGAFITEFAGPFTPAAFPSEAHDDVAVAEVGQPAPNARLTRLRTAIAPSLLNQDLMLTPSPTNAAVSNFHFLSLEQEQSEPIARLGGTGSPMLAGILALGLAWGLLRRRGRQSPR